MSATCFLLSKKSTLLPTVEVISSWVFLKKLKIKQYDKLKESLYNMFSEPFSEKITSDLWSTITGRGCIGLHSFPSDLWFVRSPVLLFKNNLIRVPPWCADISMDITLPENVNGEGGSVMWVAWCVLWDLWSWCNILLDSILLTGRCLFFLMLVLSAFCLANVAELMSCCISPCLP